MGRYTQLGLFKLMLVVNMMGLEEIGSKKPLSTGASTLQNQHFGKDGVRQLIFFKK
jgi:hypothetical protein